MTRSDWLVSTDWLDAHLGDADLRIFDATIHLRAEAPRVQSGRSDYDGGHVPGAGFLDLNGELADPDAGLEFTRPSAQRLESTLSQAGIGGGHFVVAYSTTAPMWATRLWWLLRSAGHDRCAVLDGGFAKWRSEGRAVCTEPCTYAPATFAARPREEMWATRQEVLAAVGDGAVCTLNALPRSLHTGERDMGYARPGRIAGSRNLPFPALLDNDTGELVTDAELRAHFTETGALERERVISYCGGGIAATLNAFALHLLGHQNVAVYDGSLNEWTRDESLPMETG